MGALTKYYFEIQLSTPTQYYGLIIHHFYQKVNPKHNPLGKVLGESDNEKRPNSQSDDSMSWGAKRRCLSMVR